MSETQMCECCSFDEPAIQYNETEGHMCKDCLDSWEKSHLCGKCHEWQESPCHEDRCEYCERTDDAEAEAKEIGWKRVLEDYDDHDLEPFGEAAREWNCCAVGEILGFPESDKDIRSRLPYEIIRLGEEIYENVDSGNARRAEEVRKQIPEHKDQILKIRL